MAHWLKDFLAANPDYAVLPVVKRARHAIHFQKPDGTIEAVITAQPMHYDKGGGVWEPIDTALVLEPDGYYGIPASDVKIHPDGHLKIANSDYTQYTELPGAPAGALTAEDTITREFSGGRQIMRLLEDGYWERIILDTLPPLSGAAASQFIAQATGTKPTKYQFYGTVLTDANKDDYTFTGDLNGLKKWLQAATYPVVIDPDFTGDTSDGEIHGKNAAYATANSTSYSSNDTIEWEDLGQYYYSSKYYNYRHFFKFDTSSIGSSSTVTKVNIKLTSTSDDNMQDYDDDFLIVEVAWSGALANNREANYDACKTGTAYLWANSADITLNSPHTSANLSNSWVNKTGNTTYALISSQDRVGTAPPTNDTYLVLSVAFQEYSNAALRPVLAVTYTASSPITISLAKGASTAHGKSLTVAPGAVSKALAKGSSTASGRALSVQPGPINIALAAGSSVTSGKSLTVVPGAVSKTLAKGSSTASGKALMVVPGPVSIALDAGRSTASSKALKVQPGPVSPVLASGSSTASGKALTVIPGPVSLALANGSSNATGKALKIQPGPVSIALGVGKSTVSGKALAIVPGEVIVAVGAGSSLASGNTSTIIPGAVTVQLEIGKSSATAKQAVLSAEVSIALSCGKSIAAGKALTAAPGAVGITLASGSSAASGYAAAVIPGAIAVTLETGNSTASANPVLARPGEVIIALRAGSSTANGRPVFVLGLIIALGHGSSRASGEPIKVIATVYVGLSAGHSSVNSLPASLVASTTIALAKGSSSANGSQLAVLPGGVSIGLLPGSASINPLPLLVAMATVLGVGRSYVTAYRLSVGMLPGQGEAIRVSSYGVIKVSEKAAIALSKRDSLKVSD